MCDDVESTKWFRPIAVQSGAYDGQVTIFISGPVLSLLHEMLRRKNLKELFLQHRIPPLQAIICVEPCWGDTTDPGEPVLISQCLYFSPAIPLLQTAEPFESAMAYGLSSVQSGQEFAKTESGFTLQFVQLLSWVKWLPDGIQITFAANWKASNS